VNKCPKREADEKGKEKSGSSANLATSSNTLRNLGSREIGQLYMVSNKGSPSDNEVLLDSGATSHMFCDRGYFTKYRQSAPGETISVGDAHHVPVVGRGSVVFHSKLPQNGYRTITLHNVLHVPVLAANLVSLGTIQQTGLGVRSYDQGLVITENTDSKEELFRASFRDSTLYHIDTLTHQDSA